MAHFKKSLPEEDALRRVRIVGFEVAADSVPRLDDGPAGHFEVAGAALVRLMGFAPRPGATKAGEKSHLHTGSKLRSKQLACWRIGAPREDADFFPSLLQMDRVGESGEGRRPCFPEFSPRYRRFGDLTNLSMEDTM